MNDKVEAIVTAMGALGELWGVTYNNFLKQGFNKADALAHTKAFMSALMHEIITYGG